MTNSLGESAAGPLRVDDPLPNLLVVAIGVCLGAVALLAVGRLGLPRKRFVVRAE